VRLRRPPYQASMKSILRLPLRAIFLLFVALSLTCCGPAGEREEPPSDPSGEKTAPKVNGEASVQPHRDPVNDEIYQFRVEVRQLYNLRQFDALEKRAAELRASKETFGNGSWKIYQFYGSFEPREDEPENMWTLHDEIHKEWLAAHPGSITAHVSYIDFLAEYAWHARGGGFADTVTEEGWKLFKERLEMAANLIEKANSLEKDPMLYSAVLRVARGQGWPKERFESLLEEAHRQEPKFWGLEVSRAISLLPRWYGEPGEWEEYAAAAARREGGSGAQGYARIVLSLSGFYDNIFEETEADWPITREGLGELVANHPDSLVFPNSAALLAAKAEDREFAAAMFDVIGDRYYQGAWESPELFVMVREWARTKPGE
jgi:hypothetical protein